MISTHVLTLFPRSCPSAVSFEVSEFSVDTVEAFSNRTLAHIGKERLERFQPFFCDSNACASIVRESCVFWIGATLDHGFPTCISATVDLPVGRKSTFMGAKYSPAMSDCVGSHIKFFTAAFA